MLLSEIKWIQSKLALMLTWDLCKMLNTNVPMICKSCVPYTRSSTLKKLTVWNWRIPGRIFCTCQVSLSAEFISIITYNFDGTSIWYISSYKCICNIRHYAIWKIRFSTNLNMEEYLPTVFKDGYTCIKNFTSKWQREGNIVIND